MHQPLDAVGQSYRGFIITKYLPLNELQSTLIELVHEATGARVMQIANADPENVFSLSFQTLPDSSNGVAHILEHTSLCGSKKFPVKDPFFAMTRRSLNTYMNALTGQDFTCYPAASQVEKDFYNLLLVYLDAVFHPQLKRLSFLQEGHRLSLADPSNPASELKIEGVVYNEMKGSMASAEQRLWFHLFRHLMPDLPYAFNSGGDPKDIPSLSYENLLDFHKTFYHPSRCLFFFYGNLPLSKHLDFLLEHALQHVEKESLLPPLPPQRRFNGLRHASAPYPIAPKESPKKKTLVAFACLTVPISDQTDLLALNLIDSLLTDTDASPLTRALLESGLTTGVESSLEEEMSEIPWVLVSQGCEKDSAEKILTVIRSVWEKIASEGFDPAAIEASLHQLEFERTEIGGNGGPFGLTLFFRAALAKQHGADPEQALLIHSLFQELRERLADSNYLPCLLRKYFIDNPHAVLLSLIPDPQLEQKEREEELRHLGHIRERLSSKQLEELARQAKELSDYQASIENQSLDCLPKISLKDVPPTAKNYALQTARKTGVDLYHHNCFTNRIIYADLVYDLPETAFSDLSLLAFMGKCWTEVGCGGRTYAQTLDLQQSCVGEMLASFSISIPHGDPSRSRPLISLKAKALERNAAPMMGLFRDFSLSADFKDSSRIEELLQQEASELQQSLPRLAMGYAMQLAAGGLSAASSISEQWQGLPYFQTILRLAKTPRRDLPEQLDRLYRQTLKTLSPSLVLSCADAERRTMDPLADGLGSSLSKYSPSPWKMPAGPFKKRAQGKIIASPVAFSALAFPTISYSDKEAPFLMIATNLFENTILHPEIREKGGAYGARASYMPALGQFAFYSYRDPQIANSLDIFYKAIDKIASGAFDDRHLEEAKLGILQDLDAPLPPGQRASAAFNWLLAERTFERRNQFRSDVLKARKEDVVQAVQKHLLSRKDDGSFATFASEELLKKEAPRLPFALSIENADPFS